MRSLSSKILQAGVLAVAISLTPQFASAAENNGVCKEGAPSYNQQKCEQKIEELQREDMQPPPSDDNAPFVEDPDSVASIETIKMTNFTT